MMNHFECNKTGHPVLEFDHTDHHQLACSSRCCRLPPPPRPRRSAAFSNKVDEEDVERPAAPFCDFSLTETSEPLAAVCACTCQLALPSSASTTTIDRRSASSSRRRPPVFYSLYTFHSSVHFSRFLHCQYSHFPTCLHADRDGLRRPSPPPPAFRRSKHTGVPPGACHRPHKDVRLAQDVDPTSSPKVAGSRSDPLLCVSCCAVDHSSHFLLMTSII